jgi:hypothetical protein
LKLPMASWKWIGWSWFGLRSGRTDCADFSLLGDCQLWVVFLVNYIYKWPKFWDYVIRGKSYAIFWLKRHIRLDFGRCLSQTHLVTLVALQSLKRVYWSREFLLWKINGRKCWNYSPKVLWSLSLACLKKKHKQWRHRPLVIDEEILTNGFLSRLTDAADSVLSVNHYFGRLGLCRRRICLISTEKR